MTPTRGRDDRQEQLALEPPQRRAGGRRPIPSEPRRASTRSDLRLAEPETNDRIDLSDPLIDADSVAELLCVKRKRIYELARRPDDPLPSVRIGRAVRFVRRRVEEWVAGQAQR